MKYLFNPIEVLEKEKEEKNTVKSIVILLVASAVLALSAAIGIFRVLSSVLGTTGFDLGYFGAGLGTGIVAVIVFVLVFIGGLFFGLVLKMIFTVLGGEGGYFEGLSVIAYSLLPFSIGALISSVCTFIPFVGGVISFAALAIFGAVAYATLYRASKELFNTDMITSFIGITVLVGVMVLALYISLFSTLMGLTGIIPEFP